MSIAVRLKDIRVKRGLSQREIAKLAGVSHATWSRFEKGYTPISLHGQIIKICENLGEDPNAILEGMNPKGDFEFTIRHGSPSDRREWFLMSVARRTQVTIDFLRARYPTAIPLDRLALACGLEETEVICVLERWTSALPDRQTALKIAKAVHALTGISWSWFEFGRLTSEWSATAELVRLGRYARSKAGTVQGLQALLRLAAG